MDKIKNNMRYTDTHIYFFTDAAPFSNFYHSPFTYKGYQVKWSEQAFMLEKALCFDPSSVSKVLNADTPYKVKMAGRNVQNFNDREWKARRLDIMTEVLRHKFELPHLKNILLETGDRILVEGSKYDGAWGVKLDWRDDRILDENNWQGHNLLGKALMQVREELKLELLTANTKGLENG